MNIDLNSLYTPNIGSSMKDHIELLCELKISLENLGIKAIQLKDWSYGDISLFIPNPDNKKQKIYFGISTYWWELSGCPFSICLFKEGWDENILKNELEKFININRIDSLELIFDNDNYPFIPVSSEYLKNISLKDLSVHLASFIENLNFPFKIEYPKW
jgi:hypothetical protein